MLKTLVLFTIVSSTLCAPRYGDDGGYKGFASYKPDTALNDLLRRVGSRGASQKSGKITSNEENYDYKENPAYGAYLDDASYPRDDDSIMDNLDYNDKSPQIHSTDKLPVAPVSAYGKASQYGKDSGGYKLADVYSNEYSGENNYADDPQPYEYGYKLKDEYGNQQFKREISDGNGKVTGSYGFTDKNGLYRLVDYIADTEGFRVNVKTNEPGTMNNDPADVHIESDESTP